MPFGDAESGLLSDYKGKIVKCEFAFDALIQEGQVTVMNLTFATDNPDFPEYVEKYTCGQGWASYDGGRSVQHPDGKKGFHPNSAAGLMVVTVGKLVPEGELDKRPAHTNADAWEGLAFHMKEHTSTWKNRRTGEEGESRRNLPIEYLGNWSPPSRGETTSTPATTTSGQNATSSSATTSAFDGLDDGTMSELISTAKASEDVASFSRNVLSLDAVMKNNQLLLALTGPDAEANWQELREKD